MSVRRLSTGSVTIAGALAFVRFRWDTQLIHGRRFAALELPLPEEVFAQNMVRFAHLPSRATLEVQYRASLIELIVNLLVVTVISFVR